jgi:hypothetical protein
MELVDSTMSSGRFHATCVCVSKAKLNFLLGSYLFFTSTAH